MSIGEAIRDYRKEFKIPQREIAEKIYVDRTLIAKAESGFELSETHDADISRINWRLALEVIDQRTGGYVSNILHEVPNMDLHPSALKEVLMMDLDEAARALEGLILAKHLDPEKRKEQAEKVWLEISDVVNRSLVMRGVLEEMFDLDSERLVKKHQQEIKEGKR